MKNKQFDPTQYRIFEGITGSRLYGTATPESDTDTRGVCVPPMNVLLDPFMSFNVKDSFEDDEDRAIYDLGKFMELCSQMNPNIVELLFIPEQFTLYKDKRWDLIVQNKNLFLSKKAKYTFTGYAVSQLNSIIRHREWFISPPDHEPTREEYGLPQMPDVAMGWVNSIKQSINFDLIKPELVDTIRKEWDFRDAHRKWENYQHWLKERNPKRKASEEKIGFDGKYASHLFRLMTEGKELLLTGNITFPLPNAEWLLSIKNGAYTFEQILEMAKTMEQEFEQWYAESPLPHSPNINGLKELYYQIVLGDNNAV